MGGVAAAVSVFVNSISTTNTETAMLSRVRGMRGGEGGGLVSGVSQTEVSEASVQFLPKSDT